MLLRSKSSESSSPALSAQNRSVLGLIHLGTAQPGADAVFFGRAPVVDRVVQICSSEAPDRAALTEAHDALREHIAECEGTHVEHCSVGDVLEKQLSEHISFCWAQLYRAEKILHDMQTVRTTSEGFVSFRNRNWKRSADKATWARIQNGQLTVARAARGFLTDAYTSELSEFCGRYGIDFEAIAPGSKVTVTL